MRYPTDVSCVMGKALFAQTISGHAEIMREEKSDWHLVAKSMMYDFRLFNAEICDLP